MAAADDQPVPGVTKPEAVGPRSSAVTVIALDRWGHALLLQSSETGRPGSWRLPGALLDDGESPDGAAFRGFEKCTGHSLDNLKLFAVLRRADGLPSAPAPVTHVYYDDPDLAVENLDPGPEISARYVGPGEVSELPLADYAAALLERFFASPAYRGMFH